jgi:hypothetical protein
MHTRHLMLAVAVIGSGCGNDTPTSPTPTNRLSFFVTSATRNLGGLAAAEATCQRLAAAVGVGSRRWRAYLSVERDAANGGRSTDARSRIGSGPWLNANGVTVANSLAELHSRTGGVDAFVDERGQRIKSQWPGSPTPNEHDILTGSTADGTLTAGLTCEDWISGAANIRSQVAHADGLGPGGATTGTFTSWNSSHASGSCVNTAPGGGTGRFYCFAQ